MTKAPIFSTHVQYTRSVTGRKKGDASQRIVTVRRVVTTRHESSPIVSTVRSHVAKRDSGSELQLMNIYPWKSWRIGTIRDESPSWRRPDDSRRLVTNCHSREATMYANDESNTNKQGQKGVWIYLVLKKARRSITKPPNTVTAVKQPYTNKQDKKVCEYTSF